MGEGKRDRYTRMLMFLLPASLVIGGAAYLRLSIESGASEAAKNYKAQWKPIEGWREVDHSPMSIFRYKHPEDRVHITGSLQNLVADTNPMRDLDTNGIADFYVKTGQEKLKDYKVERLPNIKAGDHEFSVVKKEQPGHVVVNAYWVKGNTTFITSLASREPDTSTIKNYMPTLESFLKSVKFVPTTIQRLDR